MEERSLDLIFYKGQLLPASSFDFLVGEGLFFRWVKLDFLRQSESIYFCNHR